MKTIHTVESPEELAEAVRLALPSAQVTVDRYDGTSLVDVRQGEWFLVAEQRPGLGWGISTASPDPAFGEGPDEVGYSLHTAVARIVELAAGPSSTTRPLGVLLRELRVAHGLSQADLAARMGIQQGAVSKMERKADLSVNALRSYLGAIGAELMLEACTAKGEHVVLAGRRTPTSTP